MAGKKQDEPKNPPGRPKALTDAEYEEAQRMVLGGMSVRKVAIHFGVGQSSILRRGITADVEKIREVAGELVSAEQKFEALPITLQVPVRQLANDLKSISEHLAGAAKYGAQTAHKLNHIANDQVQTLDSGAKLEQNADTLRSVMAMTEGANKAATIGLNLLSSNKDMVKGALNGNEVDVSPDSLPPDAVEASHIYQRMLNGPAG